MEKLLDIFYSFIPGFIYLSTWLIILYLKYFEKINPRLIGLLLKSDNILLVSFLTVSLAIGFILHVLTNLIKKPILKYTDFYSIRDEETFKIAVRWLWANDKYKLSGFFSDRAAFFGNMFTGSIITLFLLLFLYGHVYYELLPVATVFLMFWIKYAQDHYDTAVNTCEESNCRYIRRFK